MVGSLCSLVLMGALVMCAQTAIASGALRSEELPVSVEGCPLNVTLVTRNLPSSVTESVVFPLLRISFMYYSLIGAILVLVIGLTVSALTGPNEPCRREFIVPFMRRFALPQPVPKTVQEVAPLVGKETILV
ncbi:hypothetical protein B566_EDAN012232 [Ephemera danica]|nr:hypothetical protein B566_EDAN012232 [Ephemera danica]